MTPDSFEHALKLHDPRLSLRWGKLIGCWIIERACPVSPALIDVTQNMMKRAVKTLGDPASSPADRDHAMKVCEEGLSMEDGKRIVVWANSLDNRAFDALYETDLQTHGIDKIDKTANHAEKERERQLHNEIAATSDEVDSVFQWALHKKSTELAHGKADDLMCEAMHIDAPKKKIVSKPILDAFGKDPAEKRDVKIELATS